MQQCGFCSMLSGLLRRAMCVGSRRGSSESYYRELGDQDTLSLSFQKIEDKSSDISDESEEIKMCRIVKNDMFRLALRRTFFSFVNSWCSTFDLCTLGTILYIYNLQHSTNRAVPATNCYDLLHCFFVTEDVLPALSLFLAIKSSLCPFHLSLCQNSSKLYKRFRHKNLTDGQSY
ncbi:hypothetical protein ABMA28_000604 [Loxostege sticticalis]|uniref:Uncharacterized protein n=1 Tax=Loxostege sticticalis TaxID=481309 RepID=A0ABD0TT42_LOXSC